MLTRISAGVLAAVFLAAVYYLFSGDPASKAQSGLAVRSDPRNEGTMIFSWRGRIDRPMARDISKEFNNWKDKSSRIVIELDSPGGSVSEGDRVINVIQKMKKTHAVWTYVGPENDCLSMCVPIYLQGRMRVASPTSRWLFHDAKAVDVYTGTEIIMYAHERSQSNFEFFNRYIDRSDVNPKWRNKLRAQMRLGDVWKTGQELKDERSNIVTVLE